jgi:hypothetical protein
MPSFSSSCRFFGHPGPGRSETALSDPESPAISPEFSHPIGIALAFGSLVAGSIGPTHRAMRLARFLDTKTWGKVHARTKTTMARYRQ